MPVEVNYSRELYITTTTTTPTGADKLEGCIEFTANDTADTTEANYFGSDGYKRVETTLRDVTGSMSIHALTDDVVQGRLLTAYAAGTPVYVWALSDLAAAEGSRGIRYCFKVTGKDTSGSPGEVKTLSLTLAGHGAPFAA